MPETRLAAPCDCSSTQQLQVHAVVKSAVRERLHQRNDRVPIIASHKHHHVCMFVYQSREDTLEMFIRAYEEEYGQAKLSEEDLMDKLGECRQQHAAYSTV